MKAFPITSSLDKNNGMDLRDYFAAKAMQGLLAADPECDEEDAITALIRTAYAVADAMMKARDA